MSHILFFFSLYSNHNLKWKKIIHMTYYSWWIIKWNNKVRQNDFYSCLIQQAMLLYTKIKLSKSIFIVFCQEPCSSIGTFGCFGRRHSRFKYLISQLFILQFYILLFICINVFILLYIILKFFLLINHFFFLCFRWPDLNVMYDFFCDFTWVYDIKITLVCF